MSETNIDDLSKLDNPYSLSWFDRHKMMTLGLIMIIIWGSLLTFWFIKTDEITKDPCSICAATKGQDVICSVGKFIPVKRTYYPNGSIYDDHPDVVFDGDHRIPELNFTK